MLILDADTELRRETVFLKQFAAAEAWILSGAPAALGAVQDDTPGPFAGLRVSGTGGDPIFRKSERLYDIDADQRGGGMNGITELRNPREHKP